MLATVSGRTAVLALGSGQLVMVLVMTMTPLHLHETGHGLEVVGFVIGAHTLGMFGVAPISGRLTDRLGAPLVIGAGFAMLALAGVLAALTPASGGALLAGPLFLLGAGWSFTFVAGSSLLTSAGSLSERARLQGATDALVWTVAALSEPGQRRRAGPGRLRADGGGRRGDRGAARPGHRRRPPGGARALVRLTPQE